MENPSYTPVPPAPLSQSEERNLAMLAHLSVLVNLATGFLGPVGALIIYMMYKDRSRYVAYQSMQSLIFQLIFWVGGSALVGASWALTGVLSAVLIGILCIPFACIFSFFPLGAIAYGIYGAVKCSQGEDFKYWLVGDWVRSTLNG